MHLARNSAGGFADFLGVSRKMFSDFHFARCAPDASPAQHRFGIIPIVTDGLRMKRGGMLSRSMKRRLAWLAFFAAGFWLLFFARWPKRQIAELVITPPDRGPVNLTLWASAPVVSFPFFDGDKRFVRCGDHQRMLHGSGFGYGLGKLAVSPDFKQAVVYHSFEGGQYPTIFVDLSTGELSPVPDANYFTDYVAMGWTTYQWKRSGVP